MTDNDGRFLLPELPDAGYRVWVRGYGLEDPTPVDAEPGTQLTLIAAEPAKVVEQEIIQREPKRRSRKAVTLLGMTLDDFHEVIDTYLDESRMIYVVVGDAETQLGRVPELDYGEPVVLDIYGRRQ